MLYLMIKSSSIYVDKIVWYSNRNIGFLTNEHYFAKVLGVEEGVICKCIELP